MLVLRLTAGAELGAERSDFEVDHSWYGSKRWAGRGAVVVVVMVGLPVQQWEKRRRGGDRREPVPAGRG
ncbi:hypothetical protein C5C69_13825 [Rathayibacter sp. AY1C7]|nr:hypothetical protein C5C69_13825 [Rathayibacter sp. AY1C7]PPH50973.1 hypothetical protein C5C67_12365 [Rathayibacter sp. AY1E1]